MGQSSADRLLLSESVASIFMRGVTGPTLAQPTSETENPTYQRCFEILLVTSEADNGRITNCPTYIREGFAENDRNDEEKPELHDASSFRSRT